ncbi:DUF3784 domain-containing protein [Flavobacterium sp. GSA192]|uniref:DUF3784 domain-containing protein n=1 Tax=Flavobacterium sp. GSA192 TaxID=2576304 RepID=UPI0011286A72|nr:DUF3784 domain-containing protein [Flavobacterium sp. GSA192]
MMFTLIGMSLLFIAIGFIVNEHNAKYLLSGYNTMSEEEQKKVNIKAYIQYFRKFHLFLGISFFPIGTLLTYFIDENATGVFIGIYPILAYTFFIATSFKYFNSKKNKIGVFILLGALILIIGFLGRDLQENKMFINSETIEFQGSYGEIVPLKTIKSIELVSDKPKITLRTNGFSLGSVKKGYFKTDKGEIVKLILNGDNKPYILLTKLDGKKIYYSAKEESNEKLFEEIKSTPAK